MKSLLIATSNPGKFREFEGLLGSVFNCTPLPSGTPVAIEDGKTYQENALKKAQAYYELFKKPVLSDDSGLEVDALMGAPGVDSAHYGGSKLSWPDRWRFLNEELSKVGASKSLARFRCVLCYFDGQNTPRFFEATTEGYIVSTPQGEQGFGYDPIFYSTELKKTLGQATAQEKGSVSHRARATQKFLDWIHKNVS